MSCKCDPECRKVYYAQPQLFSESIEGIPAGGKNAWRHEDCRLYTVWTGRVCNIRPRHAASLQKSGPPVQNGNRVAVVRCCSGIIRTKAEGPIHGRARKGLRSCLRDIIPNFCAGFLRKPGASEESK